MALSSNPIVEVIFDSPDRMFCTLFLQNKTPDADFEKIENTLDNESENFFSFTIDPTESPINGRSLNDLSGCDLGWVVKCFDLDKNAQIKFSFEINIIDSGSTIKSIIITEESDDVTISKSGNTAIFDGTFTFA
jgi:bacillopeptidase F (M6 metalloprotease family)